MLGGILSAPTLQAMDRWEQRMANNEMPIQAGLMFTDTQRETIARVADLIIPHTDTPGAIDVGVPDFMELMLRDCYQKPAQEAFAAGLTGLAAKGFLTLPPDQQTTVLKQVEAQAHASKEQPSFWVIAKELTLLGYFTSEAGIKASFDYQPIPGRFAAIKIKPGQKDFMYGNQA